MWTTKKIELKCQKFPIKQPFIIFYFPFISHETSKMNAQLFNSWADLSPSPSLSLSLFLTTKIWMDGGISYANRPIVNFFFFIVKKRAFLLLNETIRVKFKCYNWVRDVIKLWKLRDISYTFYNHVYILHAHLPSNAIFICLFISFWHFHPSLASHPNHHTPPTIFNIRFTLNVLR